MYLDDSGTRPTHYIALATAIIIPTALIVRLEREWQSLCAKEGFEYFHASPCNSGKKPFDGWDEEKIDRVFARTRQISKKYGAIAISAAVNKKYYDDEMPEEYRKYNGAYHYTWCLDYAIAYAERWRTLRGRVHEPFQFVFDWIDCNDPARMEIERVMSYSERVAKEQGRDGEYENYSFQLKKDIPGLQCADGIAWVCNRYALNAYKKAAFLPDRARVGWEYFGGPLADQGWLHAFEFTRKALSEYVAKEQADGRTLARFKKWESEEFEKKILIRKG